MQTIDKKIDCIGSRETCRYWKKGHKKKNLGTSGLDLGLGFRFKFRFRV